jgi:hypothetical protein
MQHNKKDRAFQNDLTIKNISAPHLHNSFSSCEKSNRIPQETAWFLSLITGVQLAADLQLGLAISYTTFITGEGYLEHLE